MSTLLLVLGAAVSIAQPQQVAPLSIPPTVAQLVIVDAFVADSKGRPITDLRQEDFELFEDNRPVKIDAFQGPAVVVPAAKTGTSTVPSRVSEGAKAAQEPLTVVIFVDRWLLSPAGRKRALDQAATLAEEHIARGARVVVIAEENGLRSLTPLTENAAVVRTALTRIQGWATVAPGAAEGRDVLENIQNRIELAEHEAKTCDGKDACLCVLPELVGMIRNYATLRAVEVQRASERMAFLMNALRGLSGRKALIYVSEGLEQRPGIQIYDQLGTICPAVLHADAMQIYSPMQEFETSSILREAAARANAARVTFYPIDARGLVGLSTGDVSQSERRYVPSANNDSIKDANLVNQYRLLAEETGGFAMIRGLDPATAMKRFDTEAQGHYVLGFVPGEPDGKSHRLRVELSPKARSSRKAEIRHRQSYFRAELPDRRGQRALSAMLFGLEENALQAEASVERTGPASAMVHASVPLSLLKSLNPNSDQSRLQIVLSFRDTGSDKSPVTVREKEMIVGLATDTSQSISGRRSVSVEVPVTPLGYEFVVGLEDIVSGSASYLRLSLDPGQGFID